MRKKSFSQKNLEKILPVHNHQNGRWSMGAYYFSGLCVIARGLSLDHVQRDTKPDIVGEVLPGSTPKPTNRPEESVPQGCEGRPGRCGILDTIHQVSGG